jgi:AbrB family looped-hinge helix DNA binding protein
MKIVPCVSGNDKRQKVGLSFDEAGKVHKCDIPVGKYDYITDIQRLKMSDMLERVQEKGQVTIPSEIRRKLKLKKGDLVMFVETEAGVMIKPAEILVSSALDEIGRALEARGIDQDELVESVREKRADWIEKEYGLKEEEG